MIFAFSNGFLNLQSEFNALNKNVNTFNKQLNADSAALDIKSQFSSTLKNFSKKMARLNDTFAKVDEHKKEIIQSYGEEEITFKLDNFLKIFYDFALNIARAREVIFFVL